MRAFVVAGGAGHGEVLQRPGANQHKPGLRDNLLLLLVPVLLLLLVSHTHISRRGYFRYSFQTSSAWLVQHVHRHLRHELSMSLVSGSKYYPPMFMVTHIVEVLSPLQSSGNSWTTCKNFVYYLGLFLWSPTNQHVIFVPCIIFPIKWPDPDNQTFIQRQQASSNQPDTTRTRRPIHPFSKVYFTQEYFQLQKLTGPKVLKVCSPVL